MAKKDQEGDRLTAEAQALKEEEDRLAAEAQALKDEEDCLALEHDEERLAAVEFAKTVFLQLRRPHPLRQRKAKFALLSQTRFFLFAQVVTPYFGWFSTANNL